MASISLPYGLLNLAIPDDLALLHYRALLWAAEQRTDGLLPAAALPVVTRRADAPDLAERLVAAGLWTVTATGWRVISDHRARVSAVRSAAGRKGAEVTNAGRQNRLTPPANVVGKTEVPDTTYTRASGTPERVSEEKETTTTTTPTTREAERVAVVDPASLIPKAQIEAMLDDLSRASQGRFNRHAGTPSDRAELALRLARYGARGPLLERMGALLLNPSAVWPWAKTMRGGGYIAPAWLLGKRDAHGDRAAVALEQLVGAARESLSADAQREREKARRAAQIEAQRQRAESTPPLAPEAFADELRRHRATLTARAA